jgi:acyl-CoA thioesterase YciA
MTKELETPPEGEPTVRTFPTHADTNFDGDVFGGWLLSQMDVAGASVAYKHAGGRVVTIAVNGMTFHKPVFVGDEVSLYAKIAKVGTTSMTVEVEAWRRSRTGVYAEKVTSATYVFVAVDEQRKPRPVQPLPRPA